MARFYGEIGYADCIESPADSGIWIDVITEFPCFGDIVRSTKKYDGAEKLNGEISINNSVSIIVDQQAIKHFFNIKYLRWEGNLWTINSIEVQSPRLILSLGSVYNGPTPSAP